MKTIEKIQHYRERLRAYKESPSADKKEPVPEEFGLTCATDKFMAKQIRDEVLKP